MRRPPAVTLPAMSAEQPTLVRLHVVFNGRVFVHDTALPADWVRRCGHDDLKEYAQDELLPEALEAAGLTFHLEFPEGADPELLDEIHRGQEPPLTMEEIRRRQLQKLGRAMSDEPPAVP